MLIMHWLNHTLNECISQHRHCHYEKERTAITMVKNNHFNDIQKKMYLMVFQELIKYVELDVLKMSFKSHISERSCSVR